MMILFVLAADARHAVLLIIPGIILMVSLLLCYPTALFDNKGPVSALSESHRLVWGNWWRTFVMLSVGVIILMVIYLVVATDRRPDCAVPAGRQRRRRGSGCCTRS